MAWNYFSRSLKAKERKFSNKRNGAEEEFSNPFKSRREICRTGNLSKIEPFSTDTTDSFNREFLEGLRNKKEFHQMVRRTKGGTNERTDGRMDEWLNGWMDGWMDGWIPIINKSEPELRALQLSKKFIEVNLRPEISLTAGE
ncbi:hypothetical protein RUM43_012233 [Polyplax serrata]|uniref:Uncharacterized protein n=1 Tax=Polyplax serrata TaxID=468196 RepID=A0AAN8NRX3_POLSC